VNGLEVQGDLTLLGGAVGIPAEIMTAASDEVTAIAAAANGVMQFRMPHAMVGTGVRISLGSAATTGIFTVDVNIAGVSILSTKVTIDATETTSVTAAVPAVLASTAWADDATVSIDIDGAADGTCTGLKVLLLGTRA
jgi:hypothetical protein